MITKEDFLNVEFLKQFKNSQEFITFMEELYVRGTEKMLEGEIDRSGEPCSSGVSEIRYGRASFELLRIRVLARSG